MNTRGASSIAVSLLGSALTGLVLAAPPANAQSAVSSRISPVAGTLSSSAVGLPGAAAESILCSGEVKITTRAVTDTSLPPAVVVSIDAGGVSCVGQSTRTAYVITGRANLTRLLVADDVVETTLAVHREIPGGIHAARTALLTLNLSYDTATGALTGAAASVGNLR